MMARIIAATALYEVPCPVCNGQGVVEDIVTVGPFGPPAYADSWEHVEELVDCPSCNGEAWLYGCDPHPLHLEEGEAEAVERDAYFELQEWTRYGRVVEVEPVEIAA